MVNIDQILPKQSTGVRATLTLGSVLFRSLMEADDIRREQEKSTTNTESDPARSFQETCDQSGLHIPDIEEALRLFAGGGPEAAGVVTEFKDLASRNPDLGSFLQKLAFVVSRPTSAEECPPPPSPSAASPPQATAPAAASASSGDSGPASTPSSSSAPKAAPPPPPLFRPDLAQRPFASPAGAPDGVTALLAKLDVLTGQLRHLEAALASIQQEQTALREHVNTELSTKRLVERVERLREGLIETQKEE